MRYFSEPYVSMVFSMNASRHGFNSASRDLVSAGSFHSFFSFRMISAIEYFSANNA